MEQNNELIKQIREAYAKEVGWPSFASMASNVNIVPRDISEIAKRYAEAIIKALQAKCERYEAALKQIEQMSDPGDYWKAICDMKQVASEALSAGEGKEVENEV